MKRQLLLILIMILPVFSFGQNMDIAKAYYTKAREAYSQKQYQQALDYLQSTKEELKSTNPDITYLEITCKVGLDKADSEIEPLIEKFLKESNSDDDRRTEVSMLLIEVRELKKKIADAPNIIKKLEEDMVYVEGATFQMGSNSNVSSGEKPIHTVTVSSFSIGKYPVTQAQWFAVMHSLPKRIFDKNCNDCPINYVSWDDAQEFIKKLNEKTGKSYRLPTEAEWEFAAKGGTRSKGYIYSGSNTLDEVGWYKDNSGKKLQPVGQKKANELGVYDMSGNILEWCNDFYDKDYYSISPKINPQGPTTNLGYGNKGHVVRGGGGWDSALDCRVAYRFINISAFYGEVGFRVVLSE